MFEIIGHAVLRLFGQRKKTNEDVFGSLYTRPDEGPAEFITGLLACIVLILAIGWVVK